MTGLAAGAKVVLRDIAFSPVFDSVGIVPVYATQTGFPVVLPGCQGRGRTNGTGCRIPHQGAGGRRQDSEIKPHRGWFPAIRVTATLSYYNDVAACAASTGTAYRGQAPPKKTKSSAPND